MMLPDAKDGPVRPVVRTFYDHLQVKCICSLVVLDRKRGHPRMIFVADLTMIMQI